MGDIYNFVYTLYFAAFLSAGPSINLLYKNWKRRGVTVFLILPLVSLLFIFAFMLIDLNLAWARPEINPTSDTYKRLITAQYVVDAVATVSLGWAYVLRLRVVINTSVHFGELPYWLGLAAWLTAIMPTVYPVSDVVGIVQVWDDSLSTCCNGNLSTYLFGAFNVAFALNDIVMEFALAYMLFSRTLIDKKRRNRLIVIALSLSAVSVGLMSGAIVTFFQSQLGTQIVYAFGLVNVWVFMETNRILGKTLEGKKSTASGSRGSDRGTKTTTSTSASSRTPTPASREFV